MEQWVFFVAQLKLFPTGTQPRSRSVFTKMRPGWKIPPVDDVDYVDGLVVIPNGGEILPGETATIWIVPATPDLWNHVAVGSQIAICEGPHVIGDVTILERRIGDPFSVADGQPS